METGDFARFHKVCQLLNYTKAQLITMDLSAILQSEVSKARHAKIKNCRARSASI